MGPSLRGTARGAPRLPALIGALALLLSSCSLGGTGSLEQGRNQDRPAPRVGRPLQPVPDVEPAGFTTPPPGRGLSRYQRQGLSWKSCKQDLQCTTVLVPLDYRNPDGVAITLSLAKRPATDARRLGSLFINPGGPGGSGVDYVDYFQRKGLEGYDIVGWDPRGVGRSTPVSCSAVDLDRYLSLDVSPDTAREQSDLLDADREFGLACLATSGPLLKHVSTVEVARDLDLLRGLLGDEKATFYGASYGTQIGATYAELFPRRAGRMVLDGAVNLTDDTSVTQAQGFERALRGFADWCVARKCSLGATTSDVLRSVVALWQRLDSDPLRVGRRELSQQHAVAGVVGVLYANTDGYRYLLQALSTAIDRKDGRLLLLSADQLNERNSRGEYGQVNYGFPAVRCLDQQDLGVQGELELARAASAKAPTVGPFFGADLVCPMWPVAAVPELAIDGAGAAPILVVGTTGDPATPYEYAQRMAKQLKSAVLLTYKGSGHTAYGQSACVQQRVTEYLVRAIVPRDGSTC